MVETAPTRMEATTVSVRWCLLETTVKCVSTRKKKSYLLERIGNLKYLVLAMFLRLEKLGQLCNGNCVRTVDRV